MPRGSGSAQPSSSGKFLDRDVSVGPAATQSQALAFGGSGPAQSQLLPHGHGLPSVARCGYLPPDSWYSR